MKILSAFLFLTFLHLGFAQDEKYNPFVTIDFIILSESDNFDTILKRANAIQINQEIENECLDFAPDNETSWYSEDFLCGCGEHHGYIPRGRFDAGEYLSIELGEYFSSESKYVLIGLNGRSDDTEFLSSRERLIRVFPFAKITQEEVYIGCMH